MARIELWPRGRRIALSAASVFVLAGACAVVLPPLWRHAPVQRFCAGVALEGGEFVTPQAAVARFARQGGVYGTSQPWRVNTGTWRIASRTRAQFVDLQRKRTDPVPTPYVATSVTFDESSTNDEILWLGVDNIGAHQLRDGLWTLDGACVNTTRLRGQH